MDGKITETLKDADLEDWTSWAKKVRDTAHENRKDEEVDGPDTHVPAGSIQTSLWNQHRGAKEFEQTNKASQEASQEGSRRASHPVSCGRRQSPPWGKTEFAREMGQAVGRERGLARRLLDRISARSMDRRGKSLCNLWLAQRGGRSAGGRHKWSRCHWLRLDLLLETDFA